MIYHLTLFLICCLLFCTFIIVHSETTETEDEILSSNTDDLETEAQPILQDDITKNGEKFEFQAEVSRLMDIIVHSLYKNKDIFLRELISNASDALDKLRFLLLTDPALKEESQDLKIYINFNQEQQTLTIRDTGIGMTKDDLIGNLGTVAKSGTANFVEMIQKSKEAGKANGGEDSNLIGQFGVGFYSVYLVADKVRVISKNPKDEQYIWESTADESFTITKDPRGNTLRHGTEIILYLKKDAKTFAEQEKLKNLVTHYSEFITFPIYLNTTHTETVEVKEPETEPTDIEDKNKEDDEELETKEETEPKEKEKKTETKTVWKWELINSVKPIWKRPAKEISDEEYENFYQSFSKNSNEKPIAWTHFKTDGQMQFSAILYVPEKAPYDFYNKYTDNAASVKFYVRRVLVTDDFKEFLPKYLNFMIGVVDSDDIPINVSRETLQEHRVIKLMKKKLLKKAIDMLTTLSKSKDEADDDDDEEKEKENEKKEKKDSKYIKFWKQFGKSIKLGVIEETKHKKKLIDLLRFKSSYSNDTYTSLRDYVKRMKEWQKEIYYCAGESVESIEKSPFMDKFNKKDVEVLYFVDPIDEYMLYQMRTYDDKSITSITKEGIKIGDEDEKLLKRREEYYKTEYKQLIDKLTALYGKKVTKIVVSSQESSSPAVMVTSSYGYSANMQRIMKAQTMSSDNDMMSTMGGRIMEINPRHPIVKKLNDLSSNNEDIEDLAWLLYETSSLSSGFDLDEKQGFANRMYRFMKSNLGLETLDLEAEVDLPEEKSEPEEDVKDLDDEEEVEEPEDNDKSDDTVDEEEPEQPKLNEEEEDVKDEL